MGDHLRGPTDYARAGHGCAMQRARELTASASASTRSGEGWAGARSGALSNDLNVVVSEPGFVPDAALLDALRAWWDGVPASWLVDEAEVALTDALVDAGWSPERTGNWCGRTLEPPQRGVDGVTVTSVVTGDDLDAWLAVAADCGWFEGADDRAARRTLMRDSARDDRQGSWIATLRGRHVGMVRAWCESAWAEVVDVAVVPEARRGGVGTALVGTALRWAAEQGAREVVAAPSPDGWRLFEHLGFRAFPVVPDVCFYWPGDVRSADTTTDTRPASRRGDRAGWSP